MSDSGVLVLASGGIESAVLLHHLADEGRPVQPVYVRQGFRWERPEVLALEGFLQAAPREEFRPLEILVLPLADLLPASHFGREGVPPDANSPDEAVYLPGRNLTMLAKAGVLADREDLGAIALGALGGNPFPDATPGFFAQMAAVLSAGLGRPLEVRAPLAGFAKAEVILLGKTLPLHLTFSCLAPIGGVQCGCCNKCAERRRGFAAAGLPDRTTYSAAGAS